jgi:branched-chain amino acid transport system substrate-binding protein
VGEKWEKMTLSRKAKGISTVATVTIIAALVIVAAVGIYFFTQVQAPKTEILIGVTLPYTGAYSAYATWYEKAYMLWEKQVNEKGGLLGLPVRFIIYDDNSDPTTAKTAYEKLITVDGVDFILGPFASSCVFAVAPVAEANNMLFIEAGGNANMLFEQGWEYIFMTWPSRAEDLFKGLTEIIEEMPIDEGPKTAAIINADDLFPRAIATGTVALLESVGVTIVLEEEYPKGVTDISGLIVKIKDLNPDILFGGTYLPDALLIVRTCKELGCNPRIIALSTAPALSEFYETLEDDANYVVGEMQWSIEAPYPGVEELVEAFEEEYGMEPDYRVGIAYAACELLEKALGAVGMIDQDALRDYIRANVIDTVVGPMKYDERGIPEGRAMNFQWQDGEQVIIWPFDIAAGELAYPKPEWS